MFEIKQKDKMTERALLIGAYTVWDKFLVARVSVPPIVLEWELRTAVALLVSDRKIVVLG